MVPQDDRGTTIGSLEFLSAIQCRGSRVGEGPGDAGSHFSNRRTHREPPQAGSRAYCCLLQAFLSGGLRFRCQANAAGLGLDTIGFGLLLEPLVGDCALAKHFHRTGHRTDLVGTTGIRDGLRSIGCYLRSKEEKALACWFGADTSR